MGFNSAFKGLINKTPNDVQCEGLKWLDQGQKAIQTPEALLGKYRGCVLHKLAIPETSAMEGITEPQGSRPVSNILSASSHNFCRLSFLADSMDGDLTSANVVGIGGTDAVETLYSCV